MKIYESYKNLNQTETGIYYLVKAFSYDKERVECLYELIVHYCLCDLPEVAYNYYLIVKDFYENKYLQIESLGHKLFTSVEKYNFFLPYYMILVADKVKQYDTVIQMYRIAFTKKTLIGDKFYIGNFLFNLQFFIDKVDPKDTNFFKLFKEYISFLLSIHFPVFDYDFMVNYEKYGIDMPKPHVPIFSKEVCRNSNKIMIYTGFSNIKWNYTYMKTNAIGGSESAVAYLVNNFDKEYEIYVVGDVQEEHYDNIHYVTIANAIDLIKREPFRTIIVSRYISFYQIFQNFSAYETFIWAHDTELLGYGTGMSTEQILTKFADEITGCICQTEWHKKLFESRYFTLKDKIMTINNGIDTELFPPSQNQKVKNRFLYSSCSERGLSTLLQLWPEIVNKLPDAQLFISSYNDFPKNEEERKMEKIIQLNKDTIKHVGKLSQTELYALMSTVEYWLYTNCFLETSCITALEMLASQVVCLYYPIAGLNDTIGDYGIKVHKDDEIKTLLLLVDDEERKNNLKMRGKEYAMSCSWKNRSSLWNRLVIKPKKIAIFNSFPFHYEMFGFILHYAEKNNYFVDIFTNTDNNLGWFHFYQTHFENHIQFLSCSSFHKRKSNYDFIFVTTDDDYGFQSSWITDRVICLNHFYRTRNLSYINYFNIANFKGTRPDSSALTCYPLGILNKECVVTVLGGSAVAYQNLEVSVINRLRSKSNDKITINFIGRNISTKDFQCVNKEMFHINVMPNLDTKELIEELQRSSYVLINYISNDDDRHLGKKIAGSLPLALSALCLPILSKETNKQLQLKNCLEYEEDSQEPIYLSKLSFNDINELQKERKHNINIFDSFMKQIEKNNEVFYVKIFADEGVTSWLEMYMEHDFSLSSYKNKIVLTKDNNYTHAIIINTCMPILKSNIKRENVIGLSHEPYEILFNSKNKEKFISYAEKYIGKYFIGDKHDLPSPFIEGQSFLVHNKPPEHIVTKKEKFCSFVVSNNKSLEGNKYRHELLKAIIETTNLPVDIYGYSSTEYSKIYKGDERIKHPLQWKADTPFGTEPYEHYRFNICIENTISNHYFSEKIINPLIYNTIPVYLGCRNIHDYVVDSCIKLKGNVKDDIEILTNIFLNQKDFASLQIDTSSILKKNNLFYNLEKLFDNIEKPIYKTYVVHYKKLTERKQHLMSQFCELEINNFEFISLDRDDETIDTSLFEENYSKTQIAISLSHMKAYKDIVANNLDYGIILEDDVLLCPYFLNRLNNYMKQLPPDFGAVFLGEGCGIKEHRVEPERLQPNKNVYLMEQFNKTKCTDSYVVSLQCAKNIVEYLGKMQYKINEPIDWWLNRPLREIVKTDVYWCEPTLAKQGTITGFFEPSY